MTCEVSLVSQQSATLCVINSTFGCTTARKTLWVGGGCRGTFQCTVGQFDSILPCGGKGGSSQQQMECSCRRIADGEALQPSLQAPATTVLLGILSGNGRRRAAQRCAFGRTQWPSALLKQSLNPVRIVFVVGRGMPSEAASNDVLFVPFLEGFGACSGGSRDSSRDSTRQRTCTGSITTYLKLAWFFRYAVRQPEPVVARADDDTFVSLPALHSAASALHRTLRLFYAGTFEWYNWHRKTFRRTGHGFGQNMARNMGKLRANCSATGNRGNVQEALHGKCIGPFAFAKGPLFLLSQDTARTIVESQRFASDVERATRLTEGPVWWTHKIDDDVQMGLWMAELVPNLSYASFDVGSWQDRRGGSTYSALQGERLLSAHRLPWSCWRNATAAVRSWRRENAVLRQVGSCVPEGPICEECAHAPRWQAQCALQFHPSNHRSFHRTAMPCHAPRFSGVVDDEGACD